MRINSRDQEQVNQVENQHPDQQVPDRAARPGIGRRYRGDRDRGNDHGHQDELRHSGKQSVSKQKRTQIRGKAGAKGRSAARFRNGVTRRRFALTRQGA
jgi:hypothetical protein